MKWNENSSYLLQLEKYHTEIEDDSNVMKSFSNSLNNIVDVEINISWFESTCNVAAATVEELQNKLKQSITNLENAIEERDLNQDRVSKLESEVEELQTSCSELRLKLNDSHSKEDKLKEREAEISSLSNTLLMKEKEAEDSLLSASQVKTLLDKVGGIEIPMAESEVGDLVPHNSAHEEVEKLVRDRQDSEKVKDELSELTFGLEKIIGILGGELFDQKSAGVKGHLSVLEKQVVTMPLELENSKSKTQELGTKFLASQKVVDELSIKVKVLEESLQDRSAQTEIGQESSIFEAPSLPTGSEISEIKDADHNRVELSTFCRCKIKPFIPLGNIGDPFN
ncbi:hypothetical protein CMV_004636 [Castanea mollissima]|uniref:Uncharacterized protein n=1 Tax=Castanea mollissima TaxID=60419 RepID=A0A8J4RY07_9ROSI|nr:hypothetical protein CMV_004636 [Castanea mollissima]